MFVDDYLGNALWQCSCFGDLTMILARNCPFGRFVWKVALALQGVSVNLTCVAVF